MNNYISLALADMDKVPVSRLEHPGDGSMDPASCRFLAAFVRATASARVLEFGSGFSSLMIAREIAACEDNLLFSVDASPEYSASAREAVETSEVKINSEFRVAALRPVLYGPRLLTGYDLPKGLLQARGPFDLAVIDAPPYTPAVREAAFREAFPALAPGGYIIMGEANLPGGEACWAWEKGYGDAIVPVQLEGIGGGLRVVEKTDDLEPAAVYAGAFGAALGTLGLAASRLFSRK